MAAARLPEASYPSPGDSHAAISNALDRLGRLLGWAAPESRGGAFGAAIPDGAKVVVKPNWVLHQNQGPWGLEPLLTHASVIRAVVEEVLRARPSSVVLGDAPIQNCNFACLLAETGIGEWAAELAVADALVQLGALLTKRGRLMGSAGLGIFSDPSARDRRRRTNSGDPTVAKKTSNGNAHEKTSPSSSATPSSSRRHSPLRADLGAALVPDAGPPPQAARGRPLRLRHTAAASTNAGSPRPRRPPTTAPPGRGAELRRPRRQAGVHAQGRHRRRTARA